MPTPMNPLVDDASRRNAITMHDRSFLVEAGAGSGKTAVLAGRIAAMLTEGIAPARIAAVTFTEFAASELIIRVREFVAELGSGRIPNELRIAFPDGLSDRQRQNLAAANHSLDELTCSTIHGFCQRLIKPYPVEANIDPGASVMDRGQSDLAFKEISERWLRDELNREEDGLLAEMVFREPKESLEVIHTALENLRTRRSLSVDAPAALEPLVAAFQKAAGDFAAFLRDAAVEEPETVAIASRFTELANEIAFAVTSKAQTDLVRLLTTRPHQDLCTQVGSFRAYQKKGKWVAAAQKLGFSKAEGEQLNARASTHNAASCAAWNALCGATAARVLAELVCLVQPVINRFQDYKRSAALLDFDDLIFAARNLLRDHESVRKALAGRFRHLLVDEFQDTDPLQTELLWRLCGNPASESDGANWASFQIRPGSLFLVGDPKHAIYRFCGADVAVYIQARDCFLAESVESVLSISTNFRSRVPILQFVQERFENALSAASGQPGYTPLEPFLTAREDILSVSAIDIAVADANGKATSEQRRDGEAEAVAEMCARLIGSAMIFDKKLGALRPCRAGDIALLAPTGKELWRYEEALEKRGVPVATQAGKGLFRRQEIQDLLALTRALADSRDTLALGALLRGPLVGLTEEELLDIVWALPRTEDAPDKLHSLTLNVNPDWIAHPLARCMIEKLQALRRLVNATTPYDLLSQAVDVLMVRPIVLERHGDQGERAVANIDLYLSMSRSYGVRGLRAFAEAMSALWSDETDAVEGRPDAQEEAVALYSMHAAKGLEWPIVVPINTMTQIRPCGNALVNRATGRFYCPVLGVKPAGYEIAKDAENNELTRERVRLWYVAATRACELLILPRLNVTAGSKEWISILNLDLPSLPVLDLNQFAPGVGAAAASAPNGQTREIFAAEATEIVARQEKIVWLAPSRNESTKEPVLELEQPAVILPPQEDAPPDDLTPVGQVRQIQGGRERGVLLHKLIEEVLTGEIDETAAALQANRHFSHGSVLWSSVGLCRGEVPLNGLESAPRWVRRVCRRSDFR